MAAITICSDFGTPQNKVSHCFHCFPIYLPWNTVLPINRKLDLRFTKHGPVEESFQKNIYFCFIDYIKAFDCVDHNKMWKIHKEMGVPDHLTCLLRNLYAGQEAIVRTGLETTDWFPIGKGVCQGCILSPCFFNLYAEYIRRKRSITLISLLTFDFCFLC